MSKPNVVFIESSLSEGFESIYFKGAVWLFEAFLPALKGVVFGADNDVISSAWLLIGDIHDVNNAPKAAIGAYLKAIECKPTSEIWLEVATCYSAMGLRAEAMKALNEGLKLDPFDEELSSELGFLNDGIDSQVYYEQDSVWKAYEKLAENNPNAAIALLSHSHDVAGLVVKSCGYALSGMRAEFLACWEEILGHCDKIDIGSKFWFYLKNTVAICEAFFDKLVQHSSKVLHNNVPESLYCDIDHLATPKSFEAFLKEGRSLFRV